MINSKLDHLRISKIKIKYSTYYSFLIVFEFCDGSFKDTLQISNYMLIVYYLFIIFFPKKNKDFLSFFISR